MKTSIRSGKVGLTLDDPFEQMVMKIIDRVAPNTQTIIRENIVEVLKNAKAEWPVKTGKSLAGFTSAVELLASRGQIVISGTIRNSAGYSYLIRSGRDIKSVNSSGSRIKVPSGKNVWVELLRDPLNEIAPEIAEAITKELQTIGD